MEHIFMILVEDVQNLASQMVGRDLTLEELERVRDGVEFGLECWEEVVMTAVEEAVELEKERKPQERGRV